jgi:hypothetical protein
LPGNRGGIKPRMAKALLRVSAMRLISSYSAPAMEPGQWKALNLLPPDGSLCQ